MGCGASSRIAATTSASEAAFYTEAASIWDALARSHGGVAEVRLLRGSWLKEYSKTGKPLPRRQDLEREAPEAFMFAALSPPSIRMRFKGETGTLTVGVVLLVVG